LALDLFAFGLMGQVKPAGFPPEARGNDELPGVSRGIDSWVFHFKILPAILADHLRISAFGSVGKASEMKRRTCFDFADKDGRSLQSDGLRCAPAVKKRTNFKFERAEIGSLTLSQLQKSIRNRIAAAGPSCSAVGKQRSFRLKGIRQWLIRRFAFGSRHSIIA
jgi:hypothetical protein